jgi:hypothetical protein
MKTTRKTIDCPETTFRKVIGNLFSEHKTFSSISAFLNIAKEHPEFKSVGASSNWISDNLINYDLPVPLAEKKKWVPPARGNSPRVKKVPKATSERVRWEKEMREIYYASPKLIENAIRGVASACLKLHCLTCVAGERKEITNCTSFACPAWGSRPYQKDAFGVVDESDEAEENAQD